MRERAGTIREGPISPRRLPYGFLSASNAVEFGDSLADLPAAAGDTCGVTTTYVLFVAGLTVFLLNACLAAVAMTLLASQIVF